MNLYKETHRNLLLNRCTVLSLANYYRLDCEVTSEGISLISVTKKVVTFVNGYKISYVAI